MKVLYIEVYRPDGAFHQAVPIKGGKRFPEPVEAGSKVYLHYRDIVKEDLYFEEYEKEEE